MRERDPLGLSRIGERTHHSTPLRGIGIACIPAPNRSTSQYRHPQQRPMKRWRAKDARHTAVCVLVRAIVTPALRRARNRWHHWFNQISSNVVRSFESASAQWTASATYCVTLQRCLPAHQKDERAQQKIHNCVAAAYSFRSPR